jgi:hypothetical protein
VVIAAVDIILDLIGGAEGADVGAYYASSSGLSQLIRAGTFQNMSGRSLLAAYRAAGGSISDTLFWSLRRAVISQMNPLAGFINPLQNLSGLVQRLEGGVEGRFQFNFRTYIEHSGPGGQTFYTAKTYSVLSDDLDGEGAVQSMREASDVHDNPENDSLGRILGYELESIYQYAG